MRPTRGQVSLRTRLALITALAVLLAVLLAAAALYLVTSRFVQQANLDRLSAAGSVVAERVNAAVQTGMPGRLTSAATLLGEDTPAGLGLQLTYAGELVTRTRGFPALGELAPGLYTARGGYVLARDLSGLGAGPVRLTLVLDRAATEDTRAGFTRALLIVLPLSLLLAALLGRWAAGRMLRPVAALSQAARQVGQSGGQSGELRRPVPGSDRSDELGVLAAALQTSYRQLADTREREQEFLRSAAHDLRSPLAALQARVQGALARERDAAHLRHELAEVGRDLGRLGTLSEGLLLLARDPGQLRCDPLDLRVVAAAEVDAARSRWPETDFDLSGPPLTVQGDRLLLGQALANLLANAAQHAPGSAVLVRLSGQTLSVEDHGPGVPTGLLPRLTEAFYRPDSARQGGGHGLGLAIVARVAGLHGAQLDLGNRPGGGFVVSLHFPSA